MKKYTKSGSAILEDITSEADELLSEIETTQIEEIPIEETLNEESLKEEIQVKYMPVFPKINVVKTIPPKTEKQKQLNPLRIAILSWESLHSISIGGIAVHVTELASALERKGHDVHVFTRMGLLILLKISTICAGLL